MHTEATPLFSEYDRPNSDVIETRYSTVGLYIIVETYPKGAAEVLLDGFRLQDVCEPVYVEVFFPIPRGFVLLDESEMPSWLAADCFKTNHMIYGISKGGWFGGLAPQDTYLQISSVAEKEWLIVTSNTCVSVFSPSAPRVRELSA